MAFLKTCTALANSPDSIWHSLAASPGEKRVDRAVEIARRAGMPLRVAAKVDPADQEYFGSSAASSVSPT